MRLLLITMVLLLSGSMIAHAQQTQARSCTEQDLPVSERTKYIERASELIRTYYDQLLFCVGDIEVQETFIDSYMIKDGQRYMPEFMDVLGGTAQHLTPSQYFQELDKTFAGADTDALSWEIQNLTVSKDDFYMFNMVSLYTIARYNLTLKSGENILFSRECEAYCLFPKASVSILVKLMQLNPTSQGTFSNATLPQQKSVQRKNEVVVTSDMLPATDNKPRIVMHHPDLEVKVLKTSVDAKGFWVDATITNLSDSDEKVTINTGLRAYDDIGNIYYELRTFEDKMRMYVGNSNTPTNWNGQLQSVLLPSNVPVKVRILITGMPKTAKGIRRLKWALTAEGMSLYNTLIVDIYDLYTSVGDKLARPLLIPDKIDETKGRVVSACPDLTLYFDQVRMAGGTAILNFYLMNTSRKDGKIAIHRNIKVYDDMGNLYESGVRWGNPHLYVGGEKNPVNWNGQVGEVILPPNIPIKLRLEVKGLDSTTKTLSRILWHTYSQDFGTTHTRPTFTISDILLQ